MSSELIGILAVGVALAALILTTLRGTRTELRGDIARIRDELGGDIARVRDELDGSIVGVRDELGGNIARVADELHGFRDELRGDIRGLDHRMRALEDRIGAQERSTARLEGLLDGLREAVVGRAGSWSGSAAGVPVQRAAGASDPAPG